MTTFEKFEPEKINDKRKEYAKFVDDESASIADGGGGALYVYHSNITMAVNLALAVNRPLLIRGPSGCGKSSLALNIALERGLRFYRFVVRSDSKAQDLAWRYDAIRRLGDAQAATAEESQSRDYKSAKPYIEPGVLWWAFNANEAKKCGQDDTERNKTHEHKGAVVLIDEIDKADPNFANDLLIPFGEYSFKVSETQETIRLKKGGEDTWNWAPLLVITTNSERHLPEAFMRRCICLKMGMPDEKTLAKIAFNTLKIFEASPSLDSLNSLAKIAKKHSPSIPEFIDLAKACLNLDLSIDEIDEKIFNMLMTREQ